MRTIGAFEAKTHLSNLLDMVENGEDVVITRHGKPVAELVAPRQKCTNGADVEELLRVMAQVRATAAGCGPSATELIEEGRRY